MLEKIRLSDVPKIKELQVMGRRYQGRRQMYLFCEKGNEHNRRVYELIEDTLVPLFSFHQIGQIVEFFDIEGKPLINKVMPNRPFKQLPDAIIGTQAPDCSNLHYFVVKQTDG